MNALKELFIIIIVAIIYVGRVWAGWTLNGIVLTVALVAGVTALASWFGFRKIN
jgi:hypothetical protein